MIRPVLTWFAALGLLALPMYGSPINGGLANNNGGSPTAGGLADNVIAAAITPDGTWHEFLFGLAGTPVTACLGGCVPTINPVAVQDAPPWTFAGPAIITVLDLFAHGDRFQLFDNAVSIGSTSVVVNDGLNTCDNNIGCGVTDARYSRLVVAVGAGAHSLTISVIQNALGTQGGAAVFQASAAIPEPDTMLLIGGALIGLGVLRSRKKRLGKN
jgi:hypothetical protein